MLFFTHVIFEDLRNWSEIAGLCAILLLAVDAFFLMRGLRKRQTWTWWQYAVLLLSLGVGIWSLIVAAMLIRTYLNLIALLPSHSLAGYFSAYDQVHMEGVWTAQRQVAIVVGILIVIVVLFAGVWRKARVAL